MRQSSLKQVFTLLMAAMLMAGFPMAANAEGSAWNPINWFSGDSKRETPNEASRARLLEARRRAEEAQRKAEEALLQAAQAQQEAKEARHAADAELERVNNAKSKRKPSVTFHELKPMGAIAAPAVHEPEAETAKPQAQEPGFFSKESLNPVNWFKTSEEPKTAVTQPVKEEKQQKEPAAPVATTAKAAIIETQKGNITIELFPEVAPKTVANFTKLVEEGFYNKFNMKFHRVIQDFVVQTGDPTGTGAGGSNERIPLEVDNKLSHNAKGMVAMARGPDPNSATSQFYITLNPQPSLDGKYALFGRVIAGMDVIGKIEKQDMLYGIRLVDLNTVVRDPEPEKKGFFSKVF